MAWRSERNKHGGKSLLSSIMAQMVSKLAYNDQRNVSVAMASVADDVSDGENGGGNNRDARRKRKYRSAKWQRRK